MPLTLYKIEYPSGHFYIGSTTTENLKRYLKAKHKYCISQHQDLNLSCFSFEELKIETKTGFSSEQELRSFEEQEIAKYLKNPLCLNKNLQANCQKQISGKHTCPECGDKGGLHKKDCSKFKPLKVCPECGGRRAHKKACSKFKGFEICQECGGINNCHKKSCSQYKLRSTCPECNGKNGSHFKTCSKYTSAKPCPECGGIRSHYDFCSKSQGRCQYCGHSLQSNTHAKDCPLYREPKRCEYCGNTLLSHAHKKSCPLYKEPERCKYCGYSLKSHRHSKDCPLYKPTKQSKKICLECSGKGGHHKKTCSKYKRKKE